MTKEVELLLERIEQVGRRSLASTVEALQADVAAEFQRQDDKIRSLKEQVNALLGLESGQTVFKIDFRCTCGRDTTIRQNFRDPVPPHTPDCFVSRIERLP